MFSGRIVYVLSTLQLHQVLFMTKVSDGSMLQINDGTRFMTLPNSIVFLVDVDDTLLENDRIQDDLKRHIEREFGPECRDRFWIIQEELFNELGYRDYLGALQRFRVEYPYQRHLVTAANFLLDYPFADRLYPGALEVLEKLRTWGRTVILTDGDVVFQPRKVQRSGIFEAVEGHVLIYVHKEEALADVERRYPADHYVMVDDKLRILAALSWASKPSDHGIPKAGIIRERQESRGRLSGRGGRAVERSRTCTISARLYSRRINGFSLLT